VNCQGCRQHLQPFLDDELSVKDNVAVLEHVTACAACQEVFACERRIWENVRSRLARETCPPATCDRMLGAVRGEVRGRKLRGWSLVAIPVAAAAAILLLVRTFSVEPPAPTQPEAVSGRRVAFATPRKHHHSVHGELMAWAGARYDELYAALPEGEVITPATLASFAPPGRALTPVAEFEQAVKAELGADFELPEGFVEGGRVVGGELLPWHRGLIPQVVVEYGDRDLVLYEISCCQMRKLGVATKLMASLHALESDQGRQVSISACKACDVILVLRRDRAYILISRHGRDWDDDWMLKRARTLIDG
jgi:hypothetical protein